jgi:hypothetical protein
MSAHLKRKKLPATVPERLGAGRGRYICLVMVGSFEKKVASG